ncbi:peptidoglycan recognition family protein [Pseudomonas sp. RIT-PI-AD]|uniref:peptidoglycan recognition protein family protein n=1 Tax=Pseudomonas sp. RIT-PI-AD TaxID=3035294 RepID=UPI0021DA893D|nr:peptidoglycan recognition family protein [Pseudomonas sp. RIT-PI-AD]
MSSLDKDGMLIDAQVIQMRFTGIEHGELAGVHAIVVHQTDSSTAQNTFNGYKSGGNGAHFLIDKNGQIYQTASVHRRCYHVGKLIRSKCLEINKSNCDSVAMASMLAMGWRQQIKALDAHERQKDYPERYPINSDSVGIELVGKSLDATRFEAVTAQQNNSLQWLVSELYRHFSLTTSDVYRHPDVSYKSPGEASTATWK